ncbi:MAG TPA: acetyl-CoA carboxylase biotin carboxylase subunit [Elusimicrobiota bacterium]|nr:acetyl-CoA carboxylase biotin carboxylase subunit [Elusimicrobiota bacterium]
MFKKILVANRGEIAVRVLRACREMGIKSVAVYSEADRESLHVRSADEAVCIGPAPSRQSYLDMNAVLAAAKITGAQAVHPGYGFLSENEDFAEACAAAGLVFIGPKPEAIRMLGYKSEAKALARKAQVPVVPGTTGLVKGDVMKEARAIGLPVMIKAAAGGGGKGLRLARTEEELNTQLLTAQSEAKAAFGDDAVYLEKYLGHPRHVEIQIAADGRGNAVAFPERDCTVQRRNQKLIEESPSPALDEKMRREMQEAAVRLARESGYSNVGTVEFLVQDGKFYFIEVNTRLQVEHPVTESVTGLDLVQTQILIAAGEKLPFDQARAAQIRAWSVEHRINAEDPDNNFAPCPGKIEALRLPGGPGVRLETHLYAGYTVPSHYDSLLAKLVVFAPTRPEALARSRRALSEFEISGIRTTIGFHQKVLAHPDFIGGDFDTHLSEKILNNGSSHSRLAVK